MLRALLYAYVLGGLTFIPLLIFVAIFITISTSVPVTEGNATTTAGKRVDESAHGTDTTTATASDATNDLPRTRKGWLTVRRTFEETAGDGSYVTLVRSFLDARSKDPKRSRPKDMWYVVIKGTVLYLYEDEDMSECDAALELSKHQVIIYPEDLPDAELFAKRNAICLRPKPSTPTPVPGVAKQMHSRQGSVEKGVMGSRVESLSEQMVEVEKNMDAAREQIVDATTSLFIFVRSNVEMEDWYFALVHASEQPAQTPTLSPLCSIFDPMDMHHLVSTLDEQPDVIPMRWLNALLGRIFFSHYRTRSLESYIISRFMKKLSKVKRPAFLTEIAVTEVSVGNRAPMFSKPMLKELTKEGDASIEVHLLYKGEIRITLEATAVINLGARFKSYTVKLVLAAVLKELEGNLLIKVKRPPSNRIWYAFTQTPRMAMEVEPIVSDRQLTWGMILSTIESKFKEIIQESIVMPHMDDIAFFDSAIYGHRGGIWSETCRNPRATPATATGVVANRGESHSAPASVVYTDPSAQDFFTIVSKADDASVQSTPGATALQAGMLSPSHPDDSSDSFRNTTRRRTWFSSIRHEDDTSLPSPDTLLAEKHGQEEANPEGLDCSQDQLPVSGHVDSPPDSTMTGEAEPSELTRVLSRHSVSQIHSINVQVDSMDQEVRNKSNPTTLRKTSDASQARSSSPPSFFHTLKAKTADKQAIKETAKETMRKWGVNWGGFKKDPTSTTQPMDQTTGSSPPRSDHGPLTHKSHASYAEVRAAVAERKEREKLTQQLDGSELLAQLPPSPEATGTGPQNSTPLSSENFSTNLENSTSLGPAARILGPRKTSSPSISRTEAGDLHSPPTQDSIKLPIHVQPVAKTMSIPGIHASHRGEVQSMGYVAPQPPSAPGPPIAETMLKNTTIQSVYRFLKPTSPGDRNRQDSLDTAVTNAAHDVWIGPSPAEDEIDTASPPISPRLNPLSYLQPTLKSVPPPLPPRRSGNTLSPPQDDSLAGTPPFSASEALKSIVQKDERSRTQSDKELISQLGDEDHDRSVLVDTHDTGSRPLSVLSSSIDRPTPPPLPPRTLTSDTSVGR